MIHAVAPTIPAFLVMAVRVRAEQHTTRFQTCMQFQQHARQLLTRYMKQRRVGEYTIEIVIRQIELEKILLPDFAAAVGTSHVDEMRGAFQTDSDVTELDNHFEVPPGPAAKNQGL